MELKEAAKKLTNGLSPGQNGFSEFDKKFQTLKNTVEELETEMQEINVMAEFLHGGSAQVFVVFCYNVYRHIMLNALLN